MRFYNGSRYILLFFSAPVLFLKVISEILVAEKAKTKTSQLGHIAPWPEPRRSISWVPTRMCLEKFSEWWLAEGMHILQHYHRYYILDCVYPFPSQSDFMCPASIDRWVCHLIVSSSVRKNVLKLNQSH